MLSGPNILKTFSHKPAVRAAGGLRYVRQYTLGMEFLSTVTNLNILGPCGLQIISTLVTIQVQPKPAIYTVITQNTVHRIGYRKTKLDATRTQW